MIGLQVDLDRPVGIQQVTNGMPRSHRIGVVHLPVVLVFLAEGGHVPSRPVAHRRLPGIVLSRIHGALQHNHVLILQDRLGLPRSRRVGDR